MMRTIGITSLLTLIVALLLNGCEESHNGPVDPGNYHFTVSNNTASAILVKFEWQSVADSLLGTSHEEQRSIDPHQSRELDVYFTDWGSSVIVSEQAGKKKTYLVAIEQHQLNIQPNDFGTE